MNDSKSVYITKYSLSQLSKKVQLKNYDSLVFELSQLDIDLKKYYSKPELISMSAINQLLRSSLDESVREKIEETNNFKKNVKERKIFPSKPPSFHYDKACSCLSSDYENFDIPPAIPESRIEEYREYFLDNRSLYDRNYELYIRRAEKKFDVKILSIKHDEAINSGTASTDEASLTLLQKLGSLQDELDALELENNRLFESKRYMPYRVVAQVRNKPPEQKTSDDVFILEMSDFKYKLRVEVINYLVSLYFKDEMSFNESTLLALGAVPCGQCRSRTKNVKKSDTQCYHDNIPF
ncbi:hypothetical protein AB4524_00710 [Vibrio breoganii]